MASISFHGSPVTTVGELPAVGSPAPAFELAIVQDSDQEKPPESAAP